MSAFWEGLLNAVHTPSEQAERDKAGVLGRLRAEAKSLPESVTEGLKTANLVSVDNIIDAIRSLSRGSTPGEDDMGLEFFLENIHEIAPLLSSTMLKAHLELINSEDRRPRLAPMRS